MTTAPSELPTPFAAAAAAAERCIVAYLRGHSAWVGGVAFDAWGACGALGGAAGGQQQQQQQLQQQQHEAAAGPGGGGGLPPLAISRQQQQQPGQALPAPAGDLGGDRLYRLASLGQDCQLCVWDVVVSEEAVAAAQLASSLR